MEIGNQRVNCLEFVAGIDKNTRVRFHGAHRAVLASGALQRTAGGRADADHPTAGGASLVDQARRLSRHREKFRVHHVIGDGILLHRAESAKSHVQHDRRDGHALRPQGVQKLGREVQARGGCRGRALGASVHGLVALVVPQLLSNVRR